MEPSGAAWQQTSFESAGVAEFVTEFVTELVTWRNMRRQFQIAAFPRKKYWHHVDINQLQLNNNTTIIFGLCLCTRMTAFMKLVRLQIATLM